MGEKNDPSSDADSASRPRMTSIKNTDDFRLAAGLFVVEEVESLVDRLENLDLTKSLDLKKMVNEAIRNQSDDPLGLTKQKTIQTEDEINKYLVLSIVGGLGFIAGASTMYFLITN